VLLEQADGGKALAKPGLLCCAVLCCCSAVLLGTTFMHLNLKVSDSGFLPIRVMKGNS
jgi:hypothetical protein